MSEKQHTLAQTVLCATLGIFAPVVCVGWLLIRHG